MAAPATPPVRSSRAQDRCKEQWLRQELRASRRLIVNLLSWGVTVLAASELNLYYVRRDIREHLIRLGVIQSSELLPFLRWFLGTAFLLGLAYIFSKYLQRVVQRHEMYRVQLQAMPHSFSGIKETIPVGGQLSVTYYYLFFAFPLFDLCIWLLFYAGSKLSISIPF